MTTDELYIVSAVHPSLKTFRTPGKSSTPNALIAPDGPLSPIKITRRTNTCCDLVSFVCAVWVYISIVFLHCIAIFCISCFYWRVSFVLFVVFAVFLHVIRLYSFYLASDSYELRRTEVQNFIIPTPRQTMEKLNI